MKLMHLGSCTSSYKTKRIMCESLGSVSDLLLQPLKLLHSMIASLQETIGVFAFCGIQEAHWLYLDCCPMQDLLGLQPNISAGGAHQG